MPMPIGYASNAQFNEFVRFASQEGVSGRTALESTQGTGVMSITAKSKRDFVGNIGRSGESKAVNKNVRDLFMNSVLKMFGASKLEDLPDVVRTAMKPEDFKAQGKPLTARRVLAVQTAVRQNEMEMLIGSEMGIDVGANKELRNRIHTLVEACGGDEDAFSVIQENYRDILFEKKDGQSADGLVLRGDKAVRSLAKELLPGIEWLRAEIRGQKADPEFFDVAKPFLASHLQDPDLRGKLKHCLSEAKTHNRRLGIGHLAPILNLTSSASAQDIHEAAATLDELIVRAFPMSAAKQLKKPRDEYSEQLFANLALTRAFPDKAALRKVQTALHSETASKLARYYDDRKSEFVGRCHNGASWEDAISSYTHYALALDQLRRTVDQLCDGPQSADKPGEKFDGYVGEDFAPEIQRAVEKEARTR